MKKLLLLLALGFSCSAFAGVFGRSVSDRTRQDVQIKEAVFPSNPEPTCSALSAATVSIVNEAVSPDELTIPVADMSGCAACRDAANPDAGVRVKMPLPATAGGCGIPISGAACPTYGDVMIE